MKAPAGPSSPIFSTGKPAIHSTPGTWAITSLSDVTALTSRSSTPDTGQQAAGMGPEETVGPQKNQDAV